MTVSVFAQPRVKDKTFLNNVIILNLGDYASQNLDKLDVWHYADLNINDITDKNVYIQRYDYIDKFGELILSDIPVKTSKIMSYNSITHTLNVLGSSIDYEERKMLNYGDEFTFIIPADTPIDKDVKIGKYYQRNGAPADNYRLIKYDGDSRITAWACEDEPYVYIKYTNNNLITNFSTVEHFNPRQYIKQKHLKVEYCWSEHNIQSIKISQVFQSGNKEGSLKPIKNIECQIVEKNESGLWVIMDVIESLYFVGGNTSTNKYRLIRNFEDIKQ